MGFSVILRGLRVFLGGLVGMVVLVAFAAWSSSQVIPGVLAVFWVDIGSEACSSMVGVVVVVFTSASWRIMVLRLVDLASSLVSTVMSTMFLYALVIDSAARAPLPRPSPMASSGGMSLRA